MQPSPKLPQKNRCNKWCRKSGPVFRVSENSVTYIDITFRATTVHHECKMPHTRIVILEFWFFFRPHGQCWNPTLLASLPHLEIIDLSLKLVGDRPSQFLKITYHVTFVLPLYSKKRHSLCRSSLSATSIEMRVLFSVWECVLLGSVSTNSLRTTHHLKLHNWRPFDDKMKYQKSLVSN